VRCLSRAARDRRATVFPYTTFFRSLMPRSVVSPGPVYCRVPAVVPLPSEIAPLPADGAPRLLLADPPPTELSDATLSVPPRTDRSEEHTSELQSPYDLVCRLLLEKQ